MAGSVIRLLERTVFDYSSLGNGTSTGEIPIALDVDISGSRETTLLIRTHAFTITSGSFAVIARASAPTDEEPNSFFRDPTTSPLTVTLPATTFGGAQQQLTRLEIPANTGGWVTVFLQASKTSGTLTGTYSIDLSLKD